MAVAAEELVFEAFVGVVGGFDAASDFVALATAADALSFLSSDSKIDYSKIIQRADTFSNLNYNSTTGQPNMDLYGKYNSHPTTTLCSTYPLLW